MASDSLGSLIVSLVAETAQFRTEMTGAAEHGRTQLQSISDSASSTSSALSSLTHYAQMAGEAIIAALGSEVVMKITELVAASIEANARMAELAIQVGTTATNLSKLVPAASASGMSMDAVAAASDKFSKQLETAQTGTGKAAQALAALGLSAQDAGKFLQDPVAGMQAVAVAMAGFADDGTKAAVAMQLFGKSGAEVLPFLDELAKQGDLYATTTERQVQSAHDLTLAWRDMQLQSSLLKNSVVGELQPAFTNILNAFIDVSNQSGGLKDGLRGLIADGTIAAWAMQAAVSLAHLADEFVDEITTVKEFVKLILSCGDYVADFARVIQGSAEVMSGNFAAGAADVRAGLDGMKGAMSNAKDAALALWNQKPTDEYFQALTTAAINNQLAAGAVTEHADAHLKLAPAIKATTDEQQKFLDGLILQAVEQDMSTTALLTFKAAMIGVADQAKVYIDIIAAGILKKQDDDAEMRKATADAKALGDAITSAKDASIKALDAMIKTNDALIIERDTLGMTDMQRRQYILGLQLAKAQEDNNTEAVTQLTEQMQHLQEIAGSQAMIDAAKASAAAWKNTANDIESAMETAFSDAFNRTKTGAADSKEFLESMFKKLILQPLLQPIAGSIAGSLGSIGGLVSSNAQAFGGGAGGLGSSLGGLGNIGTMLSGGMQGLLTGGASAGLGAVAGDAYLPGALASGLGVAAGGVASAIGVALPWVGLAIGAASMLGLFNKGGGAKGGGFASTDSGASRYFTPNTNDAALQTMVSGWAQSYNSTVSALGGSAGSASFGIGYDTDPSGTAQNRISVGATVNGQSVYGFRDESVGRDDATLQADLSLEAQRALLAALQQSDLPSGVADILNAVVASTGTADQITQVLALGTAFKTLGDVLAADPIADAIAGMKTQSQGAVGAFNAQATAVAALTKSFDGSTTSTTNLATAATTLYNAAVQAVAQIESIKSGLSSSASGDIRSWTLSTMSPDQQQAYYTADEASLRSQLAAAKDPTQINTLTNQILSDFNASFNLLTPEQRAASLGSYTQSTSQLNTYSQGLLTAIEGGINKTLTDAVTAAQIAITDAATALRQAGVDQVTAANTQVTAANTPKKISIAVSASPGLQTQTNVG